MTSIGLWELAVLALLREAPLHPYEMQRLLRERHTEDLLPLKRGSLYHAIDRLVKAGWIEAIATTREGRRPERTTYRLMAGGEDELLRRLRDTVQASQPEFPVFMTCISFLVHLTPEDARQQLEARAARIEQDIEQYTRGLKHVPAHVDRILLIEIDYFLAMRKAELEWLRRLTEDIHAGRLHWNLQDMLAASRSGQQKQEA